MRTVWLAGMTLLASLAWPASTVAQDGAVPLLEWRERYNGMASEAGLAVSALAVDPDLEAFLEAEARLADLAAGLDGIVPDPCYEELHDYARASAESVLTGVRISRDGFALGTGDGEDRLLHASALRDLVEAANHQLRFPNAQILAWMGQACAG